MTEAFLRGDVDVGAAPKLVLLVLDATNLERNLFLASEILELNIPTVVALNLIDAADAANIRIDIESLKTKLSCPVVPVSARTGTGLAELRRTLNDVLSRRLSAETHGHCSCTVGCDGCTFAARYHWAGRVVHDTVHHPVDHGRTGNTIDRVITKPLTGIITFLVVMLAVFYLIFSLADIPMALIETGFARIAAFSGRLIPETVHYRWLWGCSIFAIAMLMFAAGYRLRRIRLSWQSVLPAVAVSAFISQLPLNDFRSLLTDGVIGGVGGVVVFLPQICILFFFISLLEDSGYMARAAFVMERLMRAVGLPGKAFVPMLSAHACAIPGIMAARVIENWRDRLVTIIVLPMLTCSARLPVYAMVAALLFSESPAQGSLVFVGAYMLGVVAALATAWGLKKTILPGEAEPLVLELPPYRMPSLRNAVLTMVDRASVFLRKAGTIILLISVLLWTLATYPKLAEGEISPAIAAKVASLQSQSQLASGEDAIHLLAQADHLIAGEQLAHSYAGRLGRLAEPVFRPLGFDWKINVGVISSFAAREVIVSTLAIVYGVGEEAAEDDATLVETLRVQQHADGTPVYTTATCLSLLVFYVLAMQCLPTQVVTRRETGTWKWALFQLGYMTTLATWLP